MVNRKNVVVNKTELEHKISIEMLRLLNSTEDLYSLMREVTNLLRDYSGCEAIGIRLRDGDDFPYFETHGFPEEFVKMENSLCARELSGQLMLDSDGNPILDCMCGNVIRGRFDPTKPFSTEYGSFWTNSTTELLASTTEEDRQARTRNRCNGEGYESVALIPLRTSEQPFGLLQLNDKRKGMFTPDSIAFLEYLADALAIVLARRQAEEVLREEKDKVQKYLDVAGIIVVIIDANKKVSLINKKGCEILGYKEKEIIGKNWFDNFLPKRIRDEVKTIFTKLMAGEIAQVEYFENPVLTKSGEERIIAWHNTILKDEKGIIIATLSSGEDVTERNRAEEALQNVLKESRQRQSEISAMLEASRSVMEYREFKDAARAIFDSCKNLLGVASGYVALLTEYGTENKVLFLDSGGFPCVVDPSLPMPIRGLREVAYRNGKTVYDNDFAKSEWVGFMPEGHVKLDNVLFAPLVIGGKAVGLLGLANKPGGFTENDARIASAFGELAAIALLNSQTLESLEVSERRFRSVVETARDAIISADIRGSIIFWNHAAETLFGYSSDEAVGKPLTLIMPERFHKAHQDGMQKIVSRGRSRVIGKTVEVVGLRKNGSEFPVELSLATWNIGKEICFTAIIRDISDRKRTEAALRKSEQKFRSIVEQSTDGIMLVDGQGNIIEWNRGAEHITGLNRSEVLGLPIWDLQFQIATEERRTPEMYEQLKAMLLEFLSTRQAPWLHQLSEEDIQRLDGMRRTIQSIVFPIQTEQGFMAGSIVRDISSVKKAEEKLKQIMAALERTTAELEQFVYVVSHDLQEPLRAIPSFLQLLKQRYEGKLDSDADDFIAYAVDGAKRMQQLINDLSEYSLVGIQGRGFEMTDCETVFENTIANLKVAIEESDAMITHDLLPTIMADDVQLGQLFQNLIGNAIKFRREEPPRVHVSAEQKAKEWVFSVRDNGIGIDPEYAERIFIIFQRLHTRSKYTGTGIGLAICKKIVELHGGRIWVESQTGRGSTFCFTIPIIGE